MPAFFLDISLLMLLLVVLVAIGFAWISYYPLFASNKKLNFYFLFALRTLAIFFILLLLLEPILTVIYRSTKSPSVAILIDNSRSMSIVDSKGSREKVTKEIARKLSQLEIKGGDKKFFVFSGDVEMKKDFNPESLIFSGGLTDISKALKEVRKISEQENIKAIVLVSDGIYNSGENPIHFSERIKIPIFTIGVGDSNVQKDLKVVDVLTNEITYAGFETPVIVRIESSELFGNNVVVSLYDEKREIAREKISLESGVNEYVVNFNLIPKEEGFKKFTVKVQHLPDEVTYLNNQKSFYIKVLKSKYKVLLVAGSPSPDLAFVKRTLVDSKNYEVISYVEKRGREFIKGNFDFKDVETADVIVFVGYPVKTSDIDIYNKLKSAIVAQNKPFLFLISKTVDFNKLKTLSEILPFNFSGVSGEEDLVSLVITEEGRNHAVMDLKDRNYIWNLLPPVFKIRGTFNPSVGSLVLAKTKIQGVETNEPLVIVNQFGGRKSFAILCYGIWRWKLMTARNKEFDGIFENFINNLIRWLIAPIEEEFISFKIAKNFFTEDEKIEFSSQVYAENYSPINDAEVKVKILKYENKEVVDEIKLDGLSPGVYVGRTNLAKGDYVYEAEVLWRGKTLRNFTGRFTVGESEIEFLSTRMNSKLLREIALKTGGAFLSDTEVDRIKDLLVSSVDFKAETIEKKVDYMLWSRFEVFILVVALLSVEWYARKRLGLA